MESIDVSYADRTSNFTNCFFRNWNILSSVFLIMHVTFFKVRTLKMHLFTVCQCVGLAILWVVKSTAAALFFPFFIMFMVPLRISLRFLFTHQELEYVSEFFFNEYTLSIVINRNGLETQGNLILLSLCDTVLNKKNFLMLFVILGVIKIRLVLSWMVD